MATEHDAPVRREVDASTIVYEGPHGHAVLQRLRPGALLMTSVGDFETPGTAGPMRDFDAEIEAHGSLVLCIDIAQRKVVARSSRETWGPWASRNRERVRTHILVSSKLVDMALSVMAMLAGGMAMKSYSSRADFERAVLREVPGLRRLPPLPEVGAARAARTG